MPRAAKRSNTERREESREKILDAAEDAFAMGGYNGVSMKQIAQACDVDTSLMHYYFENKEGLFRAVILRRSGAVVALRRKSLQAYVDQVGDALEVEGLLYAYLKPTFDYVRQGGDRYRNYLSIIAQLNAAPPGLMPGFETTPYDPVVQEFVALLGRAAPQRSAAEVYWFYHMLSGAITLTWAQTGRIDSLSQGLCQSEDLDRACLELIAVFADGLRRPDDPAPRPDPH